MESGRRTWAQVAGAPHKRHVMSTPAGPETVPAGVPLPPVTHSTPRRAPMLAAVSTASHSTERQKDAPPRPNIEERLPGDVLEAFLGFLDHKTLCTARLVSKAFCAAASANICSLTCSSTSQGVSLQRFPRLGRVTVHNSGQEESFAQVATGLRDLITTVKLSNCQGFNSHTLAQIALMPKLRQLELHLDLGGGNIDGIAALLSQCTNLEVLILPAHECSVVLMTTIACMTSLTELSIGRVCDPSKEVWFSVGPPDDSWLPQATTLSKLQTLRIETCDAALPLVANLTGLTRLTWFCRDPGSPQNSIDPLTCLTSLRSLCIQHGLAETNVEIACSLGSGSLVSLDLNAAYDEASDDCGRFLTCQTALARLAVQGKLCNLRHVGSLRIEMLQSLELRGLECVDAEGVSALRKATSLTRLHVSFANLDEWESEWPLHILRLSQGIAGLTGLRSLSLDFASTYYGVVCFLESAQALRPLTGLTQLELGGGGLKDADLQPLLGLTGLRVLEVYGCCLTTALVPELSVLTNLERLRLVRCGVTSEEPLTNVLNPLRHARGWPPLDCKVGR